MKINDKFKLKHKFRFRKSERTFNRLFIGFVAIMLVIVFGVIALLAYIFDMTELIKIYLDGDLGWFVILIWVVSSFVIGITVSYFFGRIIMNPIKKIIKGMGDLAEGIYDTEIEKGIDGVEVYIYKVVFTVLSKTSILNFSCYQVTRSAFNLMIDFHQIQSDNSQTHHNHTAD